MFKKKFFLIKIIKTIINLKYFIKRNNLGEIGTKYLANGLENLVNLTNLDLNIFWYTKLLFIFFIDLYFDFFIKNYKTIKKGIKLESKEHYIFLMPY